MTVGTTPSVRDFYHDRRFLSRKGSSTTAIGALQVDRREVRARYQIFPAITWTAANGSFCSGHNPARQARSGTTREPRSIVATMRTLPTFTPVASRISLLGSWPTGRSTSQRGMCLSSCAPPHMMCGAACCAAGGNTTSLRPAALVAQAHESASSAGTLPLQTPTIPPLFNAAGQSMVQAVGRMCGMTIATNKTYENVELESYWNVSPLWTNATVDAVFADETLGSAAPTMPLYHYQGLNYELIPYQSGSNLHNAYCNMGVSEDFVEYTASGNNHLMTAITGALPAISWLNTQFQNGGTGNNCSTASSAASGGTSFTIGW
jgi:hypothetical protein